MLISNAAIKINGELKGQDVRFSSVSIDTRTIKTGDLFVALRGPNFDGHEYLDVAKKNGAVAALVSKPVDTSLPTILVKDTWSGLGQLAAEWRAQFQLSMVAVTGSCGKTTLKEMIATILSLRGKTHFTQGNFNNDIGVPLTLLKLSADHEYAVIELGANHLGEIAYTANLTRPDVAVVINAGDAHIEGFGSKENVAKAKGEIFQSLNADGVAVLNRDDEFYNYWQKNTSGAKQVCFSLENSSADFFGSQLTLSQNGKYQFVLNCDIGTIEISLPLLGKFSVLNAISAAAVACSVGASLEEIKEGLESVKAIKGRLYPVTIGSQHVIDDTYNANPVSVHAAIDLLADMPGKKCLILGDMAELGVHSPSLHREVGVYAAKMQIDRLIVVGKYASDYLVGFTTYKDVEGNDRDKKGVGFDSCEEAAKFVNSELQGASILIKGSRSAEMERVIIHLETIANEKSNNVEGQG
ncbi:hypothetical protein A9Q81_09215 [Gammaproteobacteria bacterium 42_54_T18]|nr:hypothetical protein A9Q81_09215 [Gammaproteobacteria bacterium 42_54_T18]